MYTLQSSPVLRSTAKPVLAIGDCHVILEKGNSKKASDLIAEAISMIENENDLSKEKDIEEEGQLNLSKSSQNNLSRSSGSNNSTMQTAPPSFNLKLAATFEHY